MTLWAAGKVLLEFRAIPQIHARLGSLYCFGLESKTAFYDTDGRTNLLRTAIFCMQNSSPWKLLRTTCHFSSYILSAWLFTKARFALVLSLTCLLFTLGLSY